MTLEELIIYVEKRAENIPEDFDESEVNDWAGGNINDAYSLGYEHGSGEAYSKILILLKDLK